MASITLPGWMRRAKAGRTVRLFAHRRLSLLERFMLLSALIMLIGAIGIGWWIDQRIFQVVSEDSVDLAGVFVDSTIAPHLAELPVIDGPAIAQQGHLQQLIRNNVDSGRYVAINLWNPAGALLYSTLAAPPMDRYTGAGLDQALAGNTYTIKTQDVEGTTLPGKQGPYLETFFPVRRQPGGEILAVISFYQNLADTEASTLQTRLETWPMVGTATLLMYFLLFGIVRQGSETIEAQQKALDRSRRQIQQAAVRAAALNEAAMRRLGAELHDGPAQDLGIALMRIQPLRAAIAAHIAAGGAQPLDAEATAYDLQLIHTALQSSLQEIRDMAGGLRLPELADLDLTETIAKAVHDYMRKTGRTVPVDGPQHLAGSPAIKSAVFRIVQEALNNGHRHGDPAHQTVRYLVSGRQLMLEVRDDGMGFDLNLIQRQGARRQLGLAGLQERLEILGGEFEIHSAPGRGTVLRVALPMPSLSGDESGTL